MARKRRGNARTRTPVADSPAANASAKARPAARAQRVARRSNYAWHRRVPWVAVGAGVIVLVAAVFIARQFGIGESAGRYIAGGGVGQHVPVGQSIAYPSSPPTSGQHAASSTT